MNLFSRHALALHDQARAACAHEFANYGVGLRSITRPMDLCAEFFGVRREFFQISVEVKQGFVFDGSRLRAQLFPVVEAARGLEPALAEQRRRVPQSATQLHVIERRARVGVECFWGQMIHETLLSLLPLPLGEGWGEGSKPRDLAPLTPTLSPSGRGSALELVAAYEFHNDYRQFSWRIVRSFSCSSG